MTNVINATVAVIGPTGSGKSTLCNILCGRAHDDEKDFKSSNGMKSCTDKTCIVETKWRGNGFPLTLIDTPGLGNEDDEDDSNILEMIEAFQNKQNVDSLTNLTFIIVFVERA